MTGLLASVTSVEEARVVLDAGADIIDLKDPARGALGALPLKRIEAIVTAVGGRRTLSATVGDLPADPALLSRSVRATAATGVDLVKVGLFGEAYLTDCLDALAQSIADEARLIAVMFADLKPDLGIVARLADAGFTGVMLDTADKTSGGLCSHLTLLHLSKFVQSAKQLGLLTGLAGSLRREEVTALLPLRADYLGFRTALCSGQLRTAQIDAAAVASIKACLSRAGQREQALA